jgi:hypothetical protein
MDFYEVLDQLVALLQQRGPRHATRVIHQAQCPLGMIGRQVDD